MNEIRRSVSLIEKLLKKGTSPAEGMKELCDFAEGRHSHPAWKTVRRLDYAKDLETMEKWLIQLLRTEPPGDDIDGFYFGLYESEKSYVLYACGSNHYDPTDGDWACDPAWWPELRIAWSPLLIDKIHPVLGRMASDARLLGEYVIWLGYSALAVAHLCRTVDRRLLLGNLQSRAVTVGFDEGDFVNLPPLRKTPSRIRSVR